MTWIDSEEVPYCSREVAPPKASDGVAIDGAIDLSLLNGHRRTPPAMPLELLGDRWANFVQGAADAANAPIDYVVGTLLSAASAAIGNARWAEAWEGWREPPTLWVGLVGDPSSGKSPAADPILGALKKIEDEERLAFEPQWNEYLAACELADATANAWKEAIKKAISSGATPPPKPPAANRPTMLSPPRILVHDATPEALQAILCGNPRGVMAARDELAGWVGSMDRYSGRGERAFWIEAYGGRNYHVDRKGGGSLSIPRLSVALFGGMQPDKFATLAYGTDDDGLTARILWLWPEPRPYARPLRMPNPALPYGALRRLRNLPMASDQSGSCPVMMRCSPEAAEALDSWCRKHSTIEFHGGSRLKSWRGKARGHVLRLALNLEHLDWCVADGAPSAPLSIGAQAMARAVALYNSYLTPMADRVFGDAILPEVERDASAIARYIYSLRLESLNTRDVYRHNIGGISDASRANAAAEHLTERGWLVAAPSRAGNTKGRHKNDYRVNGALWAAVSRQGSG